MPREDGTGPGGFGPMTGRGAGWCAEEESVGLLSPGSGRGRGWRGRGGGHGRGGRGRRNRFHATGLTGWQRAAMGWPGYGPAPDEAPVVSKERELALLNGQREHLEGTITEITKRIEALEANDAIKTDVEP